MGSSARSTAQVLQLDKNDSAADFADAEQYEVHSDNVETAIQLLRNKAIERELNFLNGSNSCFHTARLRTPPANICTWRNSTFSRELRVDFF
jgi:hypothetical protein